MGLGVKSRVKQDFVPTNKWKIISLTMKPPCIEYIIFNIPNTTARYTKKRYGIPLCCLLFFSFHSSSTTLISSSYHRRVVIHINCICNLIVTKTSQHHLRTIHRYTVYVSVACRLPFTVYRRRAMQAKWNTISIRGENVCCVRGANTPDDQKWP